ncbi:trypco2 family protein [Streptomyces sp. XY431]|uniref:trypco2 family protein n=1 Tax=Streptomyces sp. XY431 TaxID=1415562 RepID=UPI0006AE6A62|nr:trypco2 family protein [Streptomyces sp. XY431]
MRDPLENVELTEAVQGLRDQLMAAADAADGQRIRFEVDEITLDFSVELRRDATAKAGFKAWVVSGDAQVGVAQNAVHKVSVKLKPKDSALGGPMEIGSQVAVDLGDFGHPSGLYGG